MLNLLKCFRCSLFSKGYVEKVDHSSNGVRGDKSSSGGEQNGK